MAANVNADAFIPSVWDGEVLRTLENNLVAKQICRNKPVAPAKQFGDTVWFHGLADPTVSDYTGSLTYETLVSGNVALLINKQKSYSFKVTDVEQAMANVDLKGSQAQRAGYVLRKAIDTDILGLYSEAPSGNIVTDATLDSATTISAVSECVRKLEEADVRNGNMWMVVPPWVKQKLKMAGIKFQIKNGSNASDGVEWTDELDIDLYVSNNVYRAATTPQHYCPFGSYDAIAYHEALMKSRAMELEGSFDTGVSGLVVYGCKVIKPAEFGYASLTFAAETAI